ncbi:hypothetical protein BT69DRAFT_1273753 [Atractiella rhizophila]|nr:hypothetical protein BT69DRAFT_1273753 [Atractiella rhizophila]
MAVQISNVNDIRVEKHPIPLFKGFPNTSILSKPLLIYRSVFPSTTSSSEIANHLSSIGVVAPQWTYTMYSFSHFHSTAHEVLCVSQGSASLCFGGEENPGRVETTVKKGDVIIVPAGVAHRLLEDLEGGYEMVGSYPKGTNWDNCKGDEAELEEVTERISKLKWFDRDPIYGDEGPALQS